MCAWVQPDIGVIVNIGPVHLERMRSLDGIVAAKAEILEQAATAPPCSTSTPTAWPRWPTGWPPAGKRVVRVARPSAPAADVVRPRRRRRAPTRSRCTSPAELRHRISDTTAQAGQRGRRPRPRARPRPRRWTPSLAPARLAARSASTARRSRRSAEGRDRSSTTRSRRTRPARRPSLALLDRLAARSGRAVVVTPGHGGARAGCQFEENRQFAVDADDVATDLVIVGPDEPQGPAGRGRPPRHR